MSKVLYCFLFVGMVTKSILFGSDVYCIEIYCSIDFGGGWVACPTGYPTQIKLCLICLETRGTSESSQAVKTTIFRNSCGCGREWTDKIWWNSYNHSIEEYVLLTTQLTQVLGKLGTALQQIVTWNQWMFGSFRWFHHVFWLRKF